MEAPRRREVELTANRQLSPSIHVLDFRTRDGDAISIAPGQYVSFYLTRNGRTLMRSYSLFSSAGQLKRFSLLVKHVPGGYGSTFLCGLDPASADPLTVLAPLGRFVLTDPVDRAVVFVATGTGVAPFRPMTEALHDRYPHTTTWLVYGNRHLEDAVCMSDFRALAAQWPVFHFVPVLSRPEGSTAGTEAVGHVQDVLTGVMADLPRADVYLCGVPEMVNDVQSLVERLGTPRDHVFVERH
jgi:ferredoxin-NADP reductase